MAEPEEELSPGTTAKYPHCGWIFRGGQTSAGPFQGLAVRLAGWALDRTLQEASEVPCPPAPLRSPPALPSCAPIPTSFLLSPSLPHPSRHHHGIAAEQKPSEIVTHFSPPATCQSPSPCLPGLAAPQPHHPAQAGGSVALRMRRTGSKPHLDR